MTTVPDLATLRLCSILTSSAFAAMFVAIWAGARSRSYMLHWATSASLYPLALVAFELIEGRGGAIRALVFGMLAATDALILIGVLRFHQRRIAKGDGAVVGLVVVVPVVGAAFPLIWNEPSLIAFDIAMAGLAIGKSIAAARLVLERNEAVPLGQRLAGCAMLAYAPVYLLAIAGSHFGLEQYQVGAMLPMLADQVLLAAMNIALMAMPAERSNRYFREKSLRDPLTGVRNRAWLEIYKAEHPQAEAAIIIVDIDHFKGINDRYGHAAGDRVLTTFAAHANELVEAQNGMLARLGGDEFVAIVPGANEERAGRIAYDLLTSIRRRAPGTPVATASLGVAVAMEGDDLSNVMARADDCLYDAKAAGRDQIAFA